MRLLVVATTTSFLVVLFLFTLSGGQSGLLRERTVESQVAAGTVPPLKSPTSLASHRDSEPSPQPLKENDPSPISVSDQRWDDTITGGSNDRERRINANTVCLFNPDDDSLNNPVLIPDLCEEYQRRVGNDGGTCLEMDEDRKERAKNLRDMIGRTGNIHVLVLLMRFTDHIDRELPPRHEYDLLLNGRQTLPSLEDEGSFLSENEIQRIIPIGSVHDYVWKNSYGKLNFTATVKDWMVTNDTEIFWSRKNLFDLRESMYPLLDELDEDPTVDLKDFDSDGDGKIDLVMLIHSGYAKELGGFDCSLTAFGCRIQSHEISSSYDNWVAADGTLEVDGYTVSSGLSGICGAYISNIGTHTHEFLHSLGAEDLYDGNPFLPGDGLGYYDLMSTINGPRGHPPGLSAWTKLKLGWIDPKPIIYNGLYEMRASEMYPDYFVIDDIYPEREYLLLENRQPIEWDKFLGTGGLLIYHVDDFKLIQAGAGYPGQRGWPGNERHYRVALLGADGKYDLERGENWGDDGDYWRENDVLGPSIVERSATASGVYPNTNSYFRNNVQGEQTGLVIDNFVTILDANGGPNIIQFRVNGLKNRPPTPQPVPPTPSPTVPASTLPSLSESPAPGVRTRKPNSSPKSRCSISGSLGLGGAGGQPKNGRC